MAHASRRAHFGDAERGLLPTEGGTVPPEEPGLVWEMTARLPVRCGSARG